jgi:hypothetical protein
LLEGQKHLLIAEQQPEAVLRDIGDFNVATGIQYHVQASL